jgi:DNA-directed RNA polymerase, beta subunit/140 kD subunit
MGGPDQVYLSGLPDSEWLTVQKFINLVTIRAYSLILISAMMIECMAGKSAAVHGLVHDATPFKFTENNTAIDYFGKLLEAGKRSKNCTKYAL